MEEEEKVAAKVAVCIGNPPLVSLWQRHKDEGE